MQEKKVLQEMTSSPSAVVRNRAELETTLSQQQLMDPWLLLPSTPGGNSGGGGALIDLSDETRPSAQPPDAIDGDGVGGGDDGGPIFDSNTDRNVTVLVGRTAQLHCRVRNLANRTVSFDLFSFYSTTSTWLWPAL